jgi:hypothetical protein
MILIAFWQKNPPAKSLACREVNFRWVSLAEYTNT